MIEALSPQSIALLTSLTPVGAWIATEIVKESALIAKSIATSKITEALKKFFLYRITEKQLRDVFIQSVQAALDDPTSNLDDSTRGDLIKIQKSFKNFLRFVNKYDELINLPFPERREKSIEIFRDYIQKHVPSIKDQGLDKIEVHFSHAAFGLIQDCIKKSPEAFSGEGLASLERIENELMKIAQNNEEIRNNLELLKTTALYYQKFAPEIEGFGQYLLEIKGKIDEIRSKVDEIQSDVGKIREKQNYQTVLIEEIHKKIEIPFGKSLEYTELTKELTELEEIYHAIPVTNGPLRLKYSQKINDQKEKIESFKQDVIRLADSIQNIPIDTERRRQVKSAFEEGNFELLAELLNDKDLIKEQEHLLTQQENFDRKQEELTKKFYHNATEFLIKAQVTALDYSNPKRFDEIKGYYM